MNVVVEFVDGKITGNKPTRYDQTTHHNAGYGQTFGGCAATEYQNDRQAHNAATDAAGSPRRRDGRSATYSFSPECVHTVLAECVSETVPQVYQERAVELTTCGPSARRPSRNERSHRRSYTDGPCGSKGASGPIGRPNVPKRSRRHALRRCFAAASSAAPSARQANERESSPRPPLSRCSSPPLRRRPRSRPGRSPSAVPGAQATCAA